MKRTKADGQTCVGEVRLLPIDVGFDLRALDMPIHLPDNFTSVGLIEDGEPYRLEGTRDELAGAMRAAGYSIA